MTDPHPAQFNIERMTRLEIEAVALAKVRDVIESNGSAAEDLRAYAAALRQGLANPPPYPFPNQGPGQRAANLATSRMLITLEVGWCDFLASRIEHYEERYGAGAMSRSSICKGLTLAEVRLRAARDALREVGHI